MLSFLSDVIVLKETVRISYSLKSTVVKSFCCIMLLKYFADYLIWYCLTSICLTFGEEYICFSDESVFYSLVSFLSAITLQV